MALLEENGRLLEKLTHAMELQVVSHRIVSYRIASYRLVSYGMAWWYGKEQRSWLRPVAAGEAHPHHGTAGRPRWYQSSGSLYSLLIAAVVRVV